MFSTTWLSKGCFNLHKLGRFWRPWPLHHLKHTFHDIDKILTHKPKWNGRSYNTRKIEIGESGSRWSMKDLTITINLSPLLTLSLTILSFYQFRILYCYSNTKCKIITSLQEVMRGYRVMKLKEDCTHYY